jgi:site-specific DNA-methyltransferase (adenine-specific)
VIHLGDCLEVMAGMEPESVDAIVTDPPYGLEFMGKAWDGRNQSDADRKWIEAEGDTLAARRRNAPVYGPVTPAMQRWHQTWAQAAYRVAKPSAYLLAFGGTRTVHRMTCALEDAGWIIRDMLVWGYASGFPKSKASLKPAWEPIVMARKPGPLRMLAIDECRIGTTDSVVRLALMRTDNEVYGKGLGAGVQDEPLGRWPANIVLTEEVFGDEYSRFFLIPKSSRLDREPVLGGLPLTHAPHGNYEGRDLDNPKNHLGGMQGSQRQNHHPTVKPVDLMRHLVRLVTPTGGTVLDPFLGSGTTALAAEMEGFAWIGIEREAEYVAIAEARLNGTQRGLGLEA